MTETTRVGDLDIAYETFGSADDPALLLVMGLATQMLGWDERFCQQLADEGFHVIRFDNRDIGLSTHLHDAGTPDPLALLTGTGPAPAYRIEDMADDAIGLLDALGIGAAHLVGASMGGMIVQAAAIRHPGRVLTLTSIMSTPSTQVGKARPEAQSALLIPPATNADEAVERALAVYRVIGSPEFPLDEERLAARARLSYERSADATGVLRQLAAIVGSPDRTEGLRGVTVPTLVIHGKDDPLVEVDGGHATADAVPGSRLLVIPGMGHDLPEAVWPQVVTAIATMASGSTQPQVT
ncbi:alpha/beta fold hydrolase [Nostocoides japonicum]|nr:alpha/beta hydrolase [Tetrasphaera japonica]